MYDVGGRLWFEFFQSFVTNSGIVGLCVSASDDCSKKIMDPFINMKIRYGHLGTEFQTIIFITK